MINHLKLAVGTLAGAGMVPFAPGTFGSLVSFLLLYPIAISYGTTGLFTAILVSSALAIWAADYCESRWGEDPGSFVIDEFAGQAVVLLFLPLTGIFMEDLPWLIAAFILFRIFDIVKPFGIKRIQHFPSGIGILADDLLAGIYAWILLYFSYYLLSVM